MDFIIYSIFVIYSEKGWSVLSGCARRIMRSCAELRKPKGFTAVDCERLIN